ncbi:HAMP domain-containing sensor histidine kinase [Bacillus suaedaesalsae]|uniref:histidine kinase n=1 Tax=Bacillus suaedaesalsae TaxID=2810349 RepID=A0ABS2DFR9_9BACI|nr:HAMP domain-containing sensor histidine kinase [Bacillus suaedaesalsae]MBM6616875.1 HAMP domain-containing histidine kinase [Bacillus suaedaesalsae]
MDTKWKSRGLLFGLLFLFTFGVSSLLVGLFEGDRYFETSYFNSEQFEDEFSHFLYLLEEYELNSIVKEEIVNSIIVTKEEVEEHRYRFGDLNEQITSIKDQYEIIIQEAKDAGNQDIADLYISERDKKIEDITKNFNSEDYVSSKIKKEKQEAIENYYAEQENNKGEFEHYKKSYSYFLKNIKTGEIFTNMNIKSEAEFTEQDLLYSRSFNNKTGNLSTNGKVIDYGYSPSYIKVKDSGLFEGAIGVIKGSNSIVLAQYENYHKQQLFFFIYVGLGIASLGVSLYLFKKHRVFNRLLSDKWRELYNRLPVDVRIIMFFVTSIGVFISLSFIGSAISYIGISHIDTVFSIFLTTVIITLFLAASFIQGEYLLSHYKDVSNFEVDWKKSYIYRGFGIFKDAFLIRKIGTQFLILFIFVFGMGGITAACLVAPQFIVLLVPFVMVAAPFIFIMIKQLSLFNKIIIATSEIANGNLVSELPVKGKSILAKHASHINQLKQGVKTSRQEQVKSDRLKTELVTNISHDLRTPLTSIISYTDLLKNPELVEEDRRAYIDIIDRKAGRLKVLIDDLFDVSKMASGNIELEKKEVDVVQLLQQSLAERDDTIKSSGLDFRVQKPEHPVIATVDGQKIWRVFDNLLGNILKYSLEGTRVYISIKALDQHIEIVFKNVTKYELSENVDELFERFKRGDTSRNTDGSGLGLAIAKSIIDIHDGTLEIEVDGDLFKATVKIPK